MKIVAFLQNQWFPARSHRSIEWAYKNHGSSPEDRADLNARYLFFRCLTGRRLKAAFGDLCDDIVWENASTKIGSEACAKFPAEPEHIRAVIAHFQPDTILAFGAVAREAVASLTTRPVLVLPHPAARHATVVKELADCAAFLRQMMSVETVPPVAVV